MDMTSLPDFRGDSPEVERVCSRCGREKHDVEKRPNREWICGTCWLAINSGEPVEIETHWEQ